MCTFMRNVFFLYTLIAWCLTACSLNASISSIDQAEVEFESQARKVPDFIHGEVVTTSGGRPGYVVKAIFGEISEKTESLNGNGWQFEGVFYE